MMPKNLLRYGPLATLALILLLLAGCGDDKAGSSTSPGTLERLFSYSEIQGCGNCHGPSGEAADGPNLSDAISFRANMIGKKSDEYSWLISSTCSGDNYLVEAYKPNTSAVMAALFADYNFICFPNAHAPKHLSYSSNQALKEDMRLWIENGAKP